MSGLFLLQEAGIVAMPTDIKKIGNGEKIRMQVILQTADEFNVNKRRYPKGILDESIQRMITPRVKTGDLTGELDHPISAEPARQVTVWYKDSSHKFLDVGWDGNKVVSIIETLAATPNGCILRDLVVKDNIPVGFSYRGMGDLRTINESGGTFFEVRGNLHSVTWDSVSNPSHSAARMIRITESELAQLKESALSMLTENNLVAFTESNGMICTSNGMCYVPNAFDVLVEKKILNIVNKYKF